MGLKFNTGKGLILSKVARSLFDHRFNGIKSQTRESRIVIRPKLGPPFRRFRSKNVQQVAVHFTKPTKIKMWSIFDEERLKNSSFWK